MIFTGRWMLAYWAMGRVNIPFMLTFDSPLATHATASAMYSE
jgi:hypothetical protein